MIITPLTVDRIPDLEKLLALGEPYIRLRGSSDYWLYATLFANTCPLAITDGQVVGSVIAFRSQVDPSEIYLQDVMTHPNHRRIGITRALVEDVHRQGSLWGCQRLFLTSEPDNHAAHKAWLAMDFSNVPGDTTEQGVSVIYNYKGPGKHRAVYERQIGA
ncbi:GNAT family N-acetyltransferase [Micromonospora olivasterospora]|uniref:Acetyltransferase (GNAT) family protein n=1 Tax=Micromonospora olivasterospora TaxID=1880 RepID=A0A562I9C2_MICOL|nr:GNAT family N-acetyltransferase [Micromonospora olivasterospora]TWH67273.1 acetyltransferase (GNAT) family protein [Micromonospora olivasterospora]